MLFGKKIDIYPCVNKPTLIYVKAITSLCWQRSKSILASDANNNREIVRFQTSDGDIIEVDEAVAFIFWFINEEELGIGATIHLPTVSTNILKTIVKYCTFHALYDPQYDPRIRNKEGDKKRAEYVQKWDDIFVKQMDLATLSKVMDACDNLNIPYLLHLVDQCRDGKQIMVKYVHLLSEKQDALKVLEDGDLQTLGLMDYDKRLTHSFTAPPKVDPITGEMFTFGYQVTSPCATYHVVTKEWYMLDPVPITIPEPFMMHDFAITENYAIFIDLPLYFQPKNMAKGKNVLSFDQTKKARFGILPRYTKDGVQIRWFELPNCYIFHNANAWEDGDEVFLYTCRFPEIDLEMASGLVRKILGNYRNELYEMCFNLNTVEASQKRLSESTVDFPRINEKYIGRIMNS